MTTLQELQAKKAEIDAQIKAQRNQAVAEIRKMMDALGITVADLRGGGPIYRSKLAVKYRDDQGNTWTGVGQRPRWLKKQLLEGKTLDDFRAKK